MPKITNKVAKDDYEVHLESVAADHGLSIYAVIRKTGIHAPTIYGMINKTQMPNTNTLLILCKFLKCQLSDLITFKHSQEDEQ